MRFRLVPKSVSLDDFERRIQGLSQVFTYPPKAAIRAYPKTPLKIFGERKHGRIQKLPKFLGTPYYLRNG